VTILSFECKKCNKEFKSDVGKIKINRDQTINFQKDAPCLYCNESSKELLEITKENMDTLRDIYDEQEKKEIIKNYLPGKLVNYSRIFGRKTNINLKFNSKEYYISDNYCVISDCDCSNVIIDSYLKDNEMVPAEWSFSFTYDYSNEDISEMEGINKEQSKEIIKLLVKDMQIPFKQRHHELKNFFNEHVSNKITSEFFKNKSSIIKVGRNEPCPCGSGKKYKKCCLDKEGKQK